MAIPMFAWEAEQKRHKKFSLTVKKRENYSNPNILEHPKYIQGLLFLSLILSSPIVNILV